MKWENVFTFLGSTLNEFTTIFSMKSDGTKCKSTVFFSRFEINFTEIYLKNIAMIFIGFFVFAEPIKFFSVNGVWIILSSVTSLGYGWKYHKS